MSRLYLVRHGQAGTRKEYDALSELGKRQARLLGKYLAKEGIRFEAAISGGLRRQQQTAAEVRAAFPELPEVTVEEGWNEFDLDHVYRELAPVLCEEDPEFRSEFEAMQADAGSDRRWTASDLKIVQAWIRGHERFRGETWAAFRERITACRGGFPKVPDEDRNLIVFTSATPIGIWAALGMDVEDHRAMRLAGVLHNASFTVMRLRESEVRLHTFNASPHLEASIRTYR